jgi:Cu(I)/Ag(I) efflux system protein CusF
MKIKLVLAITLLSAAVQPALAQHKHGAAAPAAAPAAAAAELADGEIRRIDAAKGTLLVKHGEIKSINMGAMTMAFKLKDPKLAAGLKEGDKIRFAVEQAGDQLLITRIQKAP